MPSEKALLSPAQYVAIFVCMVTFTAAHTLLAQEAKSEGEFKFSYVSVSFMGELLKLVICGGLLWRQNHRQSKSINESVRSEQTDMMASQQDVDEEEMTPLTQRIKGTDKANENGGRNDVANTGVHCVEADGNMTALERLKKWFLKSWIYAVPSLLYMVDNNLMYVILIFIAPATQQLLWNVKIVWFFLKRILTRLQWGALGLLLVGVITTQSSKFLHSDGKQEILTAETHNLLIGGALVLLGSFFSSLAAVYTEYVLKSNSTGSDFWERNINMYIYGALFNLILLIIKDGSNVIEKGLFYNYNIFAVLLVLDTALNGLSTAGIYRYLDNITGVLAHVTAMLAVIAVSVWLFDFTINIVVTCGFCTCVIGIWLYHHEPLKDPLYLEKIRTTHTHLKENLNTLS